MKVTGGKQEAKFSPLKKKKKTKVSRIEGIIYINTIT